MEVGPKSQEPWEPYAVLDRIPFNPNCMGASKVELRKQSFLWKMFPKQMPSLKHREREKEREREREREREQTPQPGSKAVTVCCSTVGGL